MDDIGKKVTAPASIIPALRAVGIDYSCDNCGEQINGEATVVIVKDADNLILCNKCCKENE